MMTGMRTRRVDWRVGMTSDVGHEHRMPPVDNNRVSVACFEL